MRKLSPGTQALPPHIRVSTGDGDQGCALAQFEGILPKGPYPPCVSMAGRALFAGYPQIDVYVKMTQKVRPYFLNNFCSLNFVTKKTRVFDPTYTNDFKHWTYKMLARYLPSYMCMYFFKPYPSVFLCSKKSDPFLFRRLGEKFNFILSTPLPNQKYGIHLHLNSPNIVSKGSIKNTIALTRVMAQRSINTRQFCEPCSVRCK